MQIIEKYELESLLKVDEWPAISIYLPISRIGDQQDSIRYKNILTQLETRLVREGMQTTEVRSLLAPEFELVKDTDYWKHLGRDGLAIFLTAQTVFRYSLPVSCNTLVMTGQRFQLRPLFPLMADQGYLVLALSQNQLQLFHGDRYQLEKTALPAETPNSMSEVLKYDDPERQLQFHTKTSSSGGNRRAMFHGQGMGADDRNVHLERYFRAIDRSLAPLLADKKLPMVLAGTEELHAVYRNITKSKTILPHGIAGNIDEFSAEILHQKAWDIAKEYYAAQAQAAVYDYQDNIGGERVTDDLKSILTAALDGRIEILFVQEDAQAWGKFDARERHIIVQKNEEGQIANLLDEAVFLTLNTKGTVYVRKNEEMPTKSIICALLRY